MRVRRCSGCEATGRKCYPNTSGWFGGVGGCAITQDLCDTCWGSGDEEYPFRNLREMTERYEARVSQATFDSFLQKLNFQGPHMRAEVQGVVDVLNKVDQGDVLKGKLSFGVRRMAGLLGSMLGTMLKGSKDPEPTKAESSTDLRTKLAGHVGADMIRSVLNGPSKDSEVVHVNRKPVK